MTKEQVIELRNAKGKFTIEVNGLGIQVTADHCNGSAWLLAIHGLINRFSAVAEDLSEAEILLMIAEFERETGVIECESPEQMDVINKLYEQQLEK